MDRRELRRTFEDRPRSMGVFRLRNVQDGRFLLGSSADLPAMWNRLRFQLEAGRHPNAALQHDWQSLGAGAFVFETVDSLTPSQAPGWTPEADLAALEAMWREQLRATDGEGYPGQTPRKR